MKKKNLFVLFLCLFTSIVVSAGDLDKYLKKEYISSSGDTLKYRSFDPETIKPGEKYPLVLFLHGAGERGNDNEAQLTHGANMFLNPVVLEKYPAFIVFPQCPENQWWSNSRKPDSDGKWGRERYPQNPEITVPMQSVKELLDIYLQKDEIDKDRIYIIGLSMGGMGTFDLVCRFPDLFAAAVPICGGINPDRIASVSPTAAITIFHGDKDDTVYVENSREVYRALKNIGKAPRYIEFPGCGHNSWDPAFNYPGFIDWVFAQKK